MSFSNPPSNLCDLRGWLIQFKNFVEENNVVPENTVHAGNATPGSGSAVPTFRLLVAADIPNLDAAKITTGVFANGRINWAAPSDIGTTTPPNTIFTKILRVQNSTSTPSEIYIDAVNAQNKIIWFRTGSSARWSLFSNAITESGSNAGSNFGINRYTDAGATIDTPFEITRSTGDWTRNGAAGLNRAIWWKSNGTNRFALYLNNVSESGSNAGSNFIIARYNDAGTLLNNSITITRSSGLIDINEITSFNSSLYRSGASGANRFIELQTNGSVRFAFGLNNVGETGSNAGSNFVLGRYSDAGAFLSDWLSIVRSSGVATINTSSLSLVGAASGSLLAIDGNAGTDRAIYYRTSGVLRWVEYVNSVSEGGSNSGSNFSIQRYNDAGASLGVVFGITRSDGTATFSNNLAVNSTLRMNNVAGTFRPIQFESSASARWNMGTNNVAESGSNAGSNFYIQRYNDAGAALGNPVLSIVRSSGGTTLEGTYFLINSNTVGGEAALYLDGANLTNRIINFRTNGGIRWQLYAGSGNETGASVGSDFGITRWNDAAGSLGEAFGIARNTGHITMQAGLLVGSSAGTANFIRLHQSSNSGGLANYVTFGGFTSVASLTATLDVLRLWVGTTVYYLRLFTTP